ncbi:MAG: USH1C-binding protein 1, partial [Deltaproteobacteria bacterium]|nr:USH1C-binding protein 1 [Deltaproteobacteria bacterium]
AVKGKYTLMPPEMKAYMDANGLAYDHQSNDDYHSADDWEVAITSLKAHQDQLGTNTQQLMVYIQDFMGQYNSYLQGANSSVQQSNQTLADLARLR